MGLFSPSSNKKIYGKPFKKSLKEIPRLSKRKKAYVKEAFGNELRGGLTAYEIKKRSRKLMHKTGDPLKPSEVKRIKEKLLKEFK